MHMITVFMTIALLWSASQELRARYHAHRADNAEKRAIRAELLLEMRQG